MIYLQEFRYHDFVTGISIDGIGLWQRYGISLWQRYGNARFARLFPFLL
ncbi:MAG: hypothetical protein F6J90_14455 [Moorea sp. SIOASIH]|nr:hypothetical protein [Moorena sp. SIOASIH]NEO37462.1 hypothetical protein [Moorena sp. SIOASIH]